MKDSFVHLHVHSEYSLLESGARIKMLVQRAADLGMEALAITDSCAMYGVLPFYHACRKAGIKPIIGVELFLTGEEIENYTLVLLAENYTGYQNLIKLVTAARLSEKNPPGIPWQMLKQDPSLGQGLIAISPMLESDISQYLSKGETTKAESMAQDYTDFFPKSFYLEVQDHGLLEEKELFGSLLQLGKALNIPLVATNHVQYVNGEDAATYEILRAIGKGITLKESDEMYFQTGEYYLKKGLEMQEAFIFLPEVLENTRVIAQRCQLELPLGQHILPSFPLPSGIHASDYLRSRCEEGSMSRYGATIPLEVKQRLNYELEMIQRMGFSDYFLIVWDFVRYAREKGIAVGPGRGSAAGSLVAYVLQITNIDPIKYQLLFERFLNPERVSMPDIDIDFSYDRRDEVIEYVVEKYGRDRVAQIITFGTMGARAAIRDVGRVLEFPGTMVDRIARLIPQEPGVTLDKARKKSKPLDEMMEENPRLETLWRIARQIEGMPRHTSIHAAGVVISQDPLITYVPLQEGHEGHSLTQYTMEGLEEVGLLKMDFLALRNLTIIEQCVDAIETSLGKSFSLQDIPLDDSDTYDMLAKADTTGVFQLESTGMRNVLRQVKPSSFEEIIAVLALFRPGPMEFIPGYAKAKQDPKKVKYLHPTLEPILKDTYGYILYQEQIMQIASLFAGFSLGEADILRRAVSKKKKELLQEQREKFVSGCLQKGYSEDLANGLYDWIVRFADYGFNRSHSAAYALVAYQTAFLKCRYAVFFLAALLRMVTGNLDKVAEYIAECRRQSIPVFPPDLNLSEENFIVEGKGIRFGLSAIKNVGNQAVKCILAERKKGHFRNIHDFCQRIDLRICNRRVIESLIMSGCMDQFVGHRAAYLASLDEIMEWGIRIRENKMQNQLILFGEGMVENPPAIPMEFPPFSMKEKLEQEQEMVGLYVSGHPLDEYQPLFRDFQCIPTTSLKEMKEGTPIQVGGMVTSVKAISTKKGDMMAFLEMEDLSGSCEVILFPTVYGSYSHLLKKEKMLMIKGRMNHQDHGVKVIASVVLPIEPLMKKEGQGKNSLTVFIKIGRDLEKNHKKMEHLRELLLQSSGATPVILYYENKRETQRLSTEYAVDLDEKTRKEIEKLVGIGGVVIKHIQKNLL